MNQRSAIEISDLRVEYPGHLIFENMDLTIQEGEFVCLLGPSGCGKSTILRIVGELAGHAAGEVRIQEQPHGELWKSLAYVFQAPRLVPWRNALDNVGLGIQLRDPKVSRKSRRARSRVALESLNIQHLASKAGHVLSGGEQQRVSIARALAVEPKILLMDEPFSALDVQTRHAMRREIRSLWERTGITIVFVTHDVGEALALASRIVVFSGKPTQILDDIEIDPPRPVDPLSAEYEKLQHDIMSRFHDPVVVDELSAGEV